MRFENKIALVTGGASGIGRATALRLARDGAHVMIGDVNLAGLEETARLAGPQVRIAQLDVTDPDACAAFVGSTVAAFGGLDILCNIAGVLEMMALADITPQRWSRIMAVNINGVAFMTRAAMPHLVERRGNVVNLASAAGLVGVPFNAAYCASKHAVVGLTRALAIEFAGAGVRVNAVCPGGVDTPMLAGPPREGVDFALVMRSASAWLNGGALCDPADIADAVAFLASAEARQITGITMPVDGGQTAA
jgi:meso-butanediol dehydrogenase / (S,S)-butanediol dehydrogenase / diacetyl reductase